MILLFSVHLALCARRDGARQAAIRTGFLAGSVEHQTPQPPHTPPRSPIPAELLGSTLVEYTVQLGSSIVASFQITVNM